MDSAAFVTWRAEIGFLTAAQRGLAFSDWRWPKPTIRSNVGMTKSGKPRSRTRWRAWPSRPLSRRSPNRNCFQRSGAIGSLVLVVLIAAISRRRRGRANGMPRYRCKACRKTFTPLTGTPLSGLHYKDRWIDQARALICGEMIAKAAERCAIDHTTAFRWRHRFLSALNQDKPKSLSGIVEADETFNYREFSRVSIKVSLDPRANEEARPSNAACRRNKSPSSSRATEPALHSTRSYRGSTQSV